MDGQPVVVVRRNDRRCQRFQNKVNVTFAYGAKLPDPEKLFNSGFGGNTRRAIDFFEGDKVNERALKALVRAAIDYNRTNLKKNDRKPKPPRPKQLLLPQSALANKVVRVEIFGDELVFRGSIDDDLQIAVVMPVVRIGGRTFCS